MNFKLHIKKKRPIVKKYRFVENYNDYNLDNEIWKPVVGYSSYEVSNLGRVRKIEYGKHDTFKSIGNIISTRIVNGYEVVSISNGGVQSHLKVHRVVAEAFIDNINGCHYVNHKDENKLNNKVENLEWCTTAYNNTYNDRAIKVGEKERRYISIYKIINGEKEFVADKIKLSDSKLYGISYGSVYKYIDTDIAFYSRNKRCMCKVESYDNTKSIRFRNLS